MRNTTLDSIDEKDGVTSKIEEKEEEEKNKVKVESEKGNEENKVEIPIPQVVKKSPKRKSLWRKYNGGASNKIEVSSSHNKYLRPKKRKTIVSRKRAYVYSVIANDTNELSNFDISPDKVLLAMCFTTHVGLFVV